MSFKRHKFSTLSLAVAIVIYSTAYFHYQRYDWRPLELPIQKLGESTSGGFIAQLDSDFNLLIEFDQRTNPEYWLCVFGAAVDSASCAEVTSNAEVNWFISESGNLISSGDASGPERWTRPGDVYTQSIITSINAKKHSEYAITATVFGPGNMIEETHPRIVIELTPTLHKDAFVKASLISMLGHVFFLSAIVALSIELFFRSRSSKVKSEIGVHLKSGSDHNFH